MRCGRRLPGGSRRALRKAQTPDIRTRLASSNANFHARSRRLTSLYDGQCVEFGPRFKSFCCVFRRRLRAQRRAPFKQRRCRAKRSLSLAILRRCHPKRGRLLLPSCRLSQSRTSIREESFRSSFTLHPVSSTSRRYEGSIHSCATRTTQTTFRHTRWIGAFCNWYFGRRTILELTTSR